MTYKRGMRRTNSGFGGYGAAEFDLFTSRSSNEPSQCTEKWTEERIETVKKLWLEGLSARAIAVRLGGITRNAVIGKVTRLGLSGKRSTTPSLANKRRRKAQQRTSRQKKRTSPLRLLMAMPLPEARPDDIARIKLADIADLEHKHCKYPVGEPTQGFCGLDRVTGSPYCDGHSRLCFRIPDVTPRRESDRSRQLETA